MPQELITVIFRTNRNPEYYLLLQEQSNNMIRRTAILFLLALSACNKDVENANISGIIIGTKTQKPLNGIALIIEAAYYRGGDYDSYNGYEKKYLTTDINGQFETTFSKAAYIQIITHKPSGDTLLYESEIFSKNHNVKIKL